MALVLNSTQCFAIVIFFFGFLGFLFGWKRMVFIMGFTLAAILFLYIGGANGIAEVLFTRIPQTINILTNGAIGPKTPAPPSSTEVLLSALITLAVAMILGFILSGVGYKPDEIKGPPPYRVSGPASHLFLGIIPGMVTGFALISYLSHLFAANPTVSVGVTTPSTTSLGNYIVILVIVAFVAFVIYLLMNRYSRPGK
jgi:hypothetical protein